MIIIFNISAAVTGDDDCDCGGLLDKKVVLGLLIWAVLLTVVTVALIVLATKSQ